MATFFDRVQILRIASGLEDERLFFSKLIKKRVFQTPRGVNAALSRWDESGSFPQRNRLDAIVKFFEDVLSPKHKEDVAHVLNRDRNVSIAEMLERFDVRFREVEQYISSDGVLEWKNRYYRLHFMKVLIDRYEEDSKGQEILEGLLGKFYMYRKHSVLSGILKEEIIIERKLHSHCEGTYIQYNMDDSKKKNIIPFNIFYCGFYVQIFGSYVFNDRLEIIDIRLLIGNRAEINGGPEYYVGILTGIYDYAEILMAERVLVVKDSDDTTCDVNRDPVRLFPESTDKKVVEEYWKFRDAISNTRDGQVLAARLDRLETIRQ